MIAAPAISPKPFEVTTPELVSFRVVPAGLATRGVAWAIDQFILIALRLGAIFSLAAGGLIGLGLSFAVILLFDFGYFTLFEWRWAGQTPGKRLMKLRVMSASGVKVAPSEILMRNILRPIDTLPVAMALGSIVALIDPHARRLGDLVAGTLVTRAATNSLPRHIATHRRDSNSFWDDAGARSRILARVTREERDYLYDVLVRRDTLDPLRRDRLFAHAIQHFAARYDLRPEDSLSAEQAVINIALVVSRGAERSTPKLATSA